MDIHMKGLSKYVSRPHNFKIAEAIIHRRYREGEESKKHLHVHTVLAAAVGGINNVKPPSTQTRLRNMVAGIGARYLHLLLKYYN